MKLPVVFRVNIMSMAALQHWQVTCTMKSSCILHSHRVRMLYSSVHEECTCFVMVYGSVHRFPPVIDDPSLKGDPFKESNNVPIVEFHAGIGYEELTDDVVSFRKVTYSYRVIENGVYENI